MLGGPAFLQALQAPLPHDAVRADGRGHARPACPSTSPWTVSLPSAGPGWRGRPSSRRARGTRSSGWRARRPLSSGACAALRAGPRPSHGAGGQGRGRSSLGPRGPRRGHAAARPRRGPHPHRAPFRAWEGGGEYNVARGLRRCFGLRTAIVTALADNPIGRLVEDLMLAGGVDLRHVSMGALRRGRARRSATASTSPSVASASAARSASRTAATPRSASCGRAMSTGTPSSARKARAGSTPAASSPRCRSRPRRSPRRPWPPRGGTGRSSSYDLNYRPSLWKGIGGKERAQAVNRALAPLVDVMLGNEEDFSAALGFARSRARTRTCPSSTRRGTARMMARSSDAYPQPRGRGDDAARGPHGDAQRLGRGRASPTAASTAATPRPDLEILDRVGGGDSFASGLIYGLLAGMPLERALEYGAAHGALAMTTPGDTSMATLAEVEALVAGGSAAGQPLRMRVGPTGPGRSDRDPTDPCHICAARPIRPRQTR